MFVNILHSQGNLGSTLGNNICLFVPIVDYEQENCLGFVQFSVSNEQIREDGYDFGFEQ